MFIFTAKFTRKKAVLLVLALGVCIALLIVGTRLWKTQAAAPSPTSAGTADDNAARVDFLENYGWLVAPDPVETLRLLLPEDGGQVWEEYNKLQTRQGFDLSTCYGKRVERFTYTVTNYPNRSEPIQANLYVCDGVVVAGDIFCAGEAGFQATLEFPGGTDLGAK